MSEILDCRVYWGSHGCLLGRRHAGEHHCDCCKCPATQSGTNGTFILHDDECVAYAPYYGKNTKFYGEDA